MKLSLGGGGSFLYENELYHFGVKGMKWGIRRTPEEKATRRRAKGERKQAKIVEKKSRLEEDNKAQKDSIKRTAYRKRELNAERSASVLEKNKLDRKIYRDDFFTTWGQRRAQDKSYYLNSKIKELDEDILKTDVDIQNFLERININNREISRLDEKYVRVGRKYLGE